MQPRRRAFDIVYIKNGDVLQHLERMTAADDVEFGSGPDAFLFGFLRSVKEASVLLLSKGSSSRVVQPRPNLTARTIGVGTDKFARLFSRAVLMVRLMYHLIKAKPNRVLCGANQELLWVSFIYASLRRIPLVHSRHNRVSSGNGGLYRRLAVALDKACIRRVTGVICHGPYLKQELQETGIPAHKIHEFDVDLSAFAAKASVNESRAGDSDACTTILYIGRIERLKGVFDLLDALEPRLKQCPQLQLQYAGHGNASVELERQVARRGLSRQVKLLGRVPHHELTKLMTGSRGVVTPTRTEFAEGRCMVAMESLVLGVPVVAPDFGPFPFLIEHDKNGLLYEPDSVRDLASKLDLLLADGPVYVALRAGAAECGKSLRTPSLTFAQAVKRAFDGPTSRLKSLAAG